MVDASQCLGDISLEVGIVGMHRLLLFIDCLYIASLLILSDEKEECGRAVGLHVATL